MNLYFISFSKSRLYRFCNINPYEMIYFINDWAFDFLLSLTPLGFTCVLFLFSCCFL